MTRDKKVKEKKKKYNESYNSREGAEQDFDNLDNQIEGKNPVLEALKSGRSIDRILIAKGSNEGSIREIVARAKEQKIVIREIDRKKLDEISGSRAHQGIIAYVSPYNYVEVEDILNHAKNKGEDPFIIILDEITDPHNLGAIIRTAECLGAHGIVIPKRRSVGITPAVVKASAGAVEYMLISKVTNISMTIKKLQDNGVWVAGAAMDGEEIPNQDLRGPLALVIGNEGAGMGRLVKESCDFIVKIPLRGKIQSLNASVAAGILMYEVIRQRDRA